jgi:hypothetical protein
MTNLGLQGGGSNAGKHHFSLHRVQTEKLHKQQKQKEQSGPARAEEVLQVLQG